MQKNYLNTLEPMKYTDLEGEQLHRLREVEKQFNTEFGTECYFMVMEKETQRQNSMR